MLKTDLGLASLSNHIGGLARKKWKRLARMGSSGGTSNGAQISVKRIFDFVDE